MSIVDYHIPGKDIIAKRYVIDNVEPTAVIFGKFAPFSGPKGHGKLVDFAQKHFKNVIIVSPTRKTKDKNVDIFTDEQKAEIIQSATSLKFHRIPSDIPIRMFTRIVELGYERPVLIVGEDRKAEFSKFFQEYNPANRAVTDPNDPDFGKGEMVALSRTDDDTSATKVREALQADKEGFMKLTGYNESMWERMRSMLNKNLVKSEGFCYFYYSGD